jgi:hypothetical protein
MFMRKTQSERTGCIPKLKGKEEEEKTNLNNVAIYKKQKKDVSHKHCLKTFFLS